MDGKLELFEFENLIQAHYYCYQPPTDNVTVYFEQFDKNKDGSWDLSGTLLLLPVDRPGFTMGHLGHLAQGPPVVHV